MSSFSNLSSTTTTPYTQTTLTSTLSDKADFEKINENEGGNEISSTSSLLQIQKLNEIEKVFAIMIKCFIHL